MKIFVWILFFENSPVSRLRISRRARRKTAKNRVNIKYYKPPYIYMKRRRLGSRYLSDDNQINLMWFIIQK